MIVYVCSPYGGLQENYKKAVEYCKAVVQEGHVPIASHVMLHGILDDFCPLQRKLGLSTGLALVEVADEVWAFGDRITKGMAEEIAYAGKLGIPIINLIDGRGWAYVEGNELLKFALLSKKGACR